MRKQDLYKAVIDYFSVNRPDAETELHYSDPYELLVAVILSAQCTDKRVNMVTPAFFNAFPSVQALAAATPDEIYPYIKSISYPNNKARHLSGMARMLVERFNGTVPSDVALLQQLPGVGRKTANVIASVVFMQPAMAVDTHVFRVSARIGLTTGASTPLAAEKQLVKYLPQDKVYIAHHWLILHGRYVCIARNPRCSICGLRPVCRYYRKNEKKILLRNAVA